MDLKEYFGFPEGTVVKQSYIPSYFEITDMPCLPDMSFSFIRYKGYVLPKIDVGNVTSMKNMCEGCTNLTFLDLSSWDTSNVTNMEDIFYQCSNLALIDLSGWDTSKVTNMASMFSYCSNLTEIKGLENWDTSKVTNMNYMLQYCSKLTTFGAIDCSGITTKNYYPIYSSSTYNVLIDLGGFIGMKMSWDNTSGLAKCPSLTYQSCINILNGLYDFTGNGETPNSNQGKLKVHSNFLALVGDEISIGTNKGWSITA